MNQRQKDRARFVAFLLLVERSKRRGAPVTTKQLRRKYGMNSTDLRWYAREANALGWPVKNDGLGAWVMEEGR